MQRSSQSWIAVVMLSLGAIGCTDEGVGDPCIPETIPCDSQGNSCGYKASESYIEATSVQCRSRLCIVHRLDNGSAGATPSDPRQLCEDSEDPPEGCLTEASLERSVYCTCRCAGAQRAEDNCSCPDGFTCEPILNLGGPGIIGSYCVKPESTRD